MEWQTATGRRQASVPSPVRRRFLFFFFFLYDGEAGGVASGMMFLNTSV
jgi:hypothetical protein